MIPDRSSGGRYGSYGMDAVADAFRATMRTRARSNRRAILSKKLEKVTKTQMHRLHRRGPLPVVNGFITPLIPRHGKWCRGISSSDAPCREYLPTLGEKWPHSMANGLVNIPYMEHLGEDSEEVASDLLRDFIHDFDDSKTRRYAQE